MQIKKKNIWALFIFLGRMVLYCLFSFSKILGWRKKRKRNCNNFKIVCEQEEKSEKLSRHRD